MISTWRSTSPTWASTARALRERRVGDLPGLSGHLDPALHARRNVATAITPVAQAPTAIQSPEFIVKRYDDGVVVALPRPRTGKPGQGRIYQPASCGRTTRSVNIDAPPPAVAASGSEPKPVWTHTITDIILSV